MPVGGRWCAAKCSSAMAGGAWIAVELSGWSVTTCGPWSWGGEAWELANLATRCRGCHIRKDAAGKPARVDTGRAALAGAGGGNTGGPTLE